MIRRYSPQKCHPDTESRARGLRNQGCGDTIGPDVSLKIPAGALGARSPSARKARKFLANEMSPQFRMRGRWAALALEEIFFSSSSLWRVPYRRKVDFSEALAPRFGRLGWRGSSETMDKGWVAEVDATDKGYRNKRMALLDGLDTNGIDISWPLYHTSRYKGDKKLNWEGRRTWYGAELPVRY